MRDARNAIALLCALLIAPFSISSADVESDTLHGNTFQEYANGGCAYETCGLYLAPTQHITTAVTAVSCSFGLQSGAQVLIAQFTAIQPLGAVPNYATFNLPIVYTGSDDGISYLTINTPVQLFIKNGDSPYVRIVTSAGSSPQELTCTISGYHS